MIVNYKKLKVISLLRILLLLILLVASGFILRAKLNYLPKAAKFPAIISPAVLPPIPPQYLNTELIVKLKKPLSSMASKTTGRSYNFDKEPVPFDQILLTSIPQSLKNLNKQYPIQRVDKVFKITKISPQKRSVYINKRLSSSYRLIFSDDVPVVELIKELSKDPEIIYVEPNLIFTVDTFPNDPYYLDYYPRKATNSQWNPPHDYQWNLKQIKADEAWEVDTSSVIVAVIDTGVDVTHPELGLVWKNPGETPNDGIDNDENGYIDDINGINTATYLTNFNVADDNNHGTHVAGIISAKSNNSFGLAGVTSRTPIMVIKAMDANGYGQATNIATGILYAAYNGARIINMSLGGSGSSVMRDALDVAVGIGVIPVVSAGNGNNYSPSNFPASYVNAIVVGGSDEEGNKLRYANYGPNVDIAAPGGGKPCLFFTKPSYCSNILSLKSSQNANGQEFIVNSQFLRMSGTSMAAPHVTGVIALLLAHHPEYSLNHVRNYLRFNAQQSGEVGHTERLGWGLVNAQPITLGNDAVSGENISFEIQSPAEHALVGNEFNVAGLITADKFQRFAVRYRLSGDSAWKTEGVSLVGDGNIPISPPAQNYTQEKIAHIKLPVDSPRGTYEIQTILYLTDGKSLTATRNTFFLQKPNSEWLFTGEDGDRPKRSDVLVGDLDGDGLKEIILYNITDPSIGLADSFAIYNSDFGLRWQMGNSGEVVIGNIDARTPQQEVVLQTTSAITIYSAQGQLINDMTRSFNSDGLGNMLIMDADRNGRDELYIREKKKYASEYVLHSLEQDTNFNFVEKWNYSLPTSSGTTIWPVGGNIIPDSNQEILVVKPGSIIEVLNSSGQKISSYTASPAGSGIDRIILADQNNDGLSEIIFHVKWGATKSLTWNGASLVQLWSVDNSNNIQALGVADFNNDNSLEVYAETNNTLDERIIKPDGTLIYAGWSPFYWSNDNNPGILLLQTQSQSPQVYILHTASKGLDYRQYFAMRTLSNDVSQTDYVTDEWYAILPQWQDVTGALGQRQNYATNFSAALADLDSNGLTDYIIGGVGIIELETPTKIFWGQRYGNEHRTGSYSPTLALPSPIPTPPPIPPPTPTCRPRPACLDIKPFPCKLPVPSGGWCETKPKIPLIKID